MKILNNKGPTIEPWGTPVLIDCMDDFTSSIFTYYFLSDRQLFNKGILAVPFTP